MPSLFQNENTVNRLPPNGQFKTGVSNVDTLSTKPENNVKLPWSSEPAASYLYYDVSVAQYLDSGIVVHRRLPQVDNTADTLASCLLTDGSLDKVTGRGVNTISNDAYQDIVQRMAHSVYFFHLCGQAMRVGYQIPIPGMRSVAGVPAIPHDEIKQVAHNKIVGNFSGSVLWYATWSLWYTVAVPPTAQQVPPPNLAEHIAGDTPPPSGWQVPWSSPDDEAQPNTPPLQLQRGIIQP